MVTSVRAGTQLVTTCDRFIIPPQRIDRFKSLVEYC